VVLDDVLALRILSFLAGRYRPVMSDWVEVPEIAAALTIPAEDVEQRLQPLQQQGLIEVSPVDEENEQTAALITVKGLLAIGRVP
jgi:DNA-binding IclR family transcriptional regulator